jgi:hypothetical protein
VSESPASAVPGRAVGSARLALPVWTWLLFWMAGFVGVPVYVHHAVHGVVNGWHVALSFFLAINALICIWEISLGVQISQIERWHHDPAGMRERPRGSVLLASVSLPELFSTRLWARIWSEYAIYDPSYADRRSYGFAIDVGNGWSTLLPGLFLLVGMTVEIVPAVVLGLIGVLVFYQKLYGTCLYFFTYVFNRRWEGGPPLRQAMAMVGGTNGIWIVFPAIGLYVCVRLVLENRYDLIWN